MKTNYTSKQNRFHPYLKPLSLVALSGALLSLNSCDYSTSSSYDAPVVHHESLSKNKKTSQRYTSNRTLKPTVKFPARIGFIQVTSGYNNNLRVVNNRDLETEEHEKIVGSLPNLAGAVNINPSFLSSSNTSYKELGYAAQKMGCNMLAVYEFRTTARSTNGSTILSVATLGAAPTNGHKAVSTVSLTFIDAKTGYIYGVMEEKATARGLSSSWGNDSTKGSIKHRADARAFDKLVRKIPAFWPSVYSR